MLLIIYELKKKNEIKMVTKYLKTKNLDDIKEISKKINDF